MKNELRKHSQRLNLVLGVSGAMVLGLPLIEGELGPFYGVVMFITAIVSAYCVAKKQNLNG